MSGICLITNSSVTKKFKLGDILSVVLSKVSFVRCEAKAKMEITHEMQILFRAQGRAEKQ